MHYTLQGKIAKAHPYQLDTTLTVYGAGAEAESTGKAINAVKETAEEHIDNKTNPHNVTKAQVGLGDVDNTPDSEKPVSAPQAEAIAEVKKDCIDAATTAQTAADNAQVAADNAMTAANNALTESKTYADNKTKRFDVTLTSGGWVGTVAPYTQTVDVSDILSSDKPHYGVVYSSDTATKLAEKEAWMLVDDLDTADGSVTFTCLEDKPETDLTVQMEVYR